MQKRRKYKWVQIQVCFQCELESKAGFTDAGLCSLCEQKRRNTIMYEAKPDPYVDQEVTAKITVIPRTRPR